MPQNELPPILRKAFEKNCAWDEAGQEIALGSNVSLAEAQELLRIVSSQDIKNSAEVGLAYGASSIAILQGLSGSARHHIIDPFQARFDNIGLSMIEKAGLSERMRFYEKFPEEVIPLLPELDFAFIDASHLFDLTLLEFVLVDKKLKVGGLIGFHDFWMPALQKVLRFILENRSYKIVHAQPPKLSFKQKIAKGIASVPGMKQWAAPCRLKPWASMGVGNMGFIQKIAPDNRDWQYFKDF